MGAALRSSKTGKVYYGCNVENAAYPSGICAERGALCSAIASEGKNIKFDHCVVVTDAEQPAAPREVEAGSAAGPASQGQSLGQPPVPEEADLFASSPTTGAVKWPRVRTEPEQAPREPRR